MTRRFARIGALVGIAAAMAVAGVALRSIRRAVPPPPMLGKSRATLHADERRSRRVGGLDVTFVVASDTHFGSGASELDTSGLPRDPVRAPEGSELVNGRSIRAMNALPGLPWPRELGGALGTPRGVLISGDLTENGEPWQWNAFVAYFGLNGGEGLLRYPVFETHGNHDKHHSWYVLDRVRERHGSTRYAFDWDDLHVVCLGEAPDEGGLDFVAEDLRRVGPERPVIVYFHFPLRGPYSDTWFTRGGHPAELAERLRPYNVIGLFHGHYHASGRYRWSGYDVYNVGAAKHRRHSFGVVRVTDRSLRVASFHFDQQRWEWWHEKPINGAKTPVVSGGVGPGGGVMLPDD